MIGTGRGEQLNSTAIDLKGKFLVLLKPDIHVATAEAYAGITPQQPDRSVKQIIETWAIGQWKGLLKNDFEESVFKLHPVIREIKEELYAQGAIYASMSGSGSSVFGIFEKEIQPDRFQELDGWYGVLL